MTNQAMIHIPTLGERIRWGLGFKFHRGEDPEGAEKMSGWMMTTASFHFDILDRLRLLLTGRLHIQIAQHTNVQVDTSINRVDYVIKAPGER